MPVSPLIGDTNSRPETLGLYFVRRTFDFSLYTRPFLVKKNKLTFASFVRLPNKLQKPPRPTSHGFPSPRRIPSLGRAGRWRRTNERPVPGGPPSFVTECLFIGRFPPVTVPDGITPRSFSRRTWYVSLPPSPPARLPPLAGPPAPSPPATTKKKLCSRENGGAPTGGSTCRPPAAGAYGRIPGSCRPCGKRTGRGRVLVVGGAVVGVARGLSVRECEGGRVREFLCSVAACPTESEWEAPPRAAASTFSGSVCSDRTVDPLRFATTSVERPFPRKRQRAQRPTCNLLAPTRFTGTLCERHRERCGKWGSTCQRNPPHPPPPPPPPKVLWRRRGRRRPPPAVPRAARCGSSVGGESWGSTDDRWFPFPDAAQRVPPPQKSAGPGQKTTYRIRGKRLDFGLLCVNRNLQYRSSQPLLTRLSAFTSSNPCWGGGRNPPHMTV